MADSPWRVEHGDCLEVLAAMAPDSIDAIVTDGPYGIGFMGREWDTFRPGAVKQPERYEQPIESENPNLCGRRRSPALSPSQIEYDYTVDGLRRFQAETERWARQAIRVLKPGAYLLNFGAPRAYHRMACGLEDAGFVIRDKFAWLFGSGFPKSLNLARAIDMNLCELPGRHCMNQVPTGSKARPGDHVCPRSAEGLRADGTGTALKPGHEPIVVAWKPFKGTILACYAQHGTAALNVDACRLDGPPRGEAVASVVSPGLFDDGQAEHTDADDVIDVDRWPANVLLDEEAAALLDEQSGELVSGANPTRRGTDKFRGVYGDFAGQAECDAARGIDIGGASRFFYVAKPSRAERDMGTAHLRARQRDDSREADAPGANNPRNRGGQLRGNFHPTVKPIELMQWLIRLVTPPGGTVLDPFAGSGTTGMAARLEARPFIGIEREADYVELAKARIHAIAPLFSEASA